jgi:hypothetical protein
MSADAPIAETAPEAPAADAWAERRLEILSELAEAGLEIALALKTRIAETAAAEPEADNAQACADLARAFDRTSRAVRLSIALRDKLLKDAPARPAATRESPQETRSQRAERVRRIVRRAVRIHFRGENARETLDRHVSERLHDTDITGDLSSRSIGELVATICDPLGVTPDWRYFAEEAWAQAEIAERPEGSPYEAWPDLPPEAPEDPDEDAYWDGDDEDDEEDPDDPGGGGPCGRRHSAPRPTADTT